MEFLTGTGFLTSVLGGVIVSAANWLFSVEARRKTRVEARKISEEIDEVRAGIRKTNAEAEKIEKQVREQIDEIRAGIGKTNAETEKIKAETEKTKAETVLLMKPQARAVSTETWGEPPVGWLAGNVEGASDDYVVGVDQAHVHSGKSSAYIRAKTQDPKGFGALSQRFTAGSFAGKRLRLTGYLRVQSVDGWAGLWMRIDGANGELLAFDNMEQRPVRGTSEWVRREVVLNAPTDAYAIAIGALLVGAGQIWVDDLSLDVVGSDVPTTIAEEALSQSPVNLNFEVS